MRYTINEFAPEVSAKNERYVVYSYHIEEGDDIDEIIDMVKAQHPGEQIAFCHKRLEVRTVTEKPKQGVNEGKNVKRR